MLLLGLKAWGLLTGTGWYGGFVQWEKRPHKTIFAEEATG